MKKVLNTLLVVLVGLLVITSCSIDQNVADELVSVSLRTQGNGRSLTAGVDFDVSKVATWKYTAVKADNGLSTGETGKGIDNAKALTEGKTEALSQGSWNFELFGYTSDNKLICSGDVSAVTITVDKTAVTITVKPSQTENGKGKIVIAEDIKIVDKEGNVYSSTTNEYTKAVTVKNAAGTEIASLDAVPSGLYTVTVTFAATSLDGTAYTAASKTKYINVYDNLTTTVSGTVEEDESAAAITAEGGAVKASSEPVTVAKTSEGKNEKAVDVSVKSTASADTAKTTTISFPANSLAMNDSATSITVTMQSSSVENVSTTYEIESDEGAAVAGFDFTLEGADSSKFETEEGVLVTTYISAGLGVWDSSNPTLKIKYIGSNSGTEPTIESYDNDSGELKFRVYHFSKYCVVSTDKVVAIKDGGMYESLAAAVTAAKEDDTLIILKDLELTETQLISDGKDITIDLNGHTIASTTFNFKVTNAKVEFTGKGTIQTSRTSLTAAVNIVGAETDTANYSVVTIGNDVMLKGLYGVMISRNKGTDSNGKHSYGVVVNYYGSFSKEHETSYSAVGAYINGQIQDTEGNVPVVNINGATFDNGGIYTAGYAVWNIKDSNFTSSNALSMKSGTLVIDGGTYTSTGSFFDPSNDSSNASVETGAALSMTSNDGYAHKLNVTVKDGNFISQNGYAVYEGIPNKKNSTTGEKVASESYVTLDIQGGTFTGNSEKGAIKLSEIKNKYVISGGTFSSDPSDYLADDYAATENGSVWTVSKAVLSDYEAKADRRYCSTFDEAVEKAAEGSTIVLLKDVDLTNYAKTAAHELSFAKKVTLDMNGKTITSNNYGVYYEGDGLTIKNGTFKVKDSAKDDGIGSYAIFFGLNSGDSTIEGYIATLDNVTCEGGINVSSHQVVVNNSTINGTHYYALWAENKGQITVESGNFTSQCKVDNTSVLHNETEGKIIIHGGNFTAPENKTLFHKNIQSCEISGGKFNADPSKYVKNGYTATESDGIWTVSEQQ